MSVPPKTNSTQYHRVANLFAVLCVLVLGLSIAGITTASLALDVRDSFGPYREFGGRLLDVLQDGARGPSVDDFDPTATTGWMYQLLPRNIRFGNEQAVLGASISILILVLVPLITSVCKDVPLHPHHKATGFPGFNIVLAGACFLASLVGVVYTQTAIQSASVRTDLAPPLPGTSDAGKTIGSSGTYSVEGWTCEIRRIMTQFGSNGNSDYKVMSRSCHTSAAAKWIAVALLVVSTALFALSFVVVSIGGKASRVGEDKKLRVVEPDMAAEKPRSRSQS